MNRLLVDPKSKTGDCKSYTMSEIRGGDENTMNECQKPVGYG